MQNFKFIYSDITNPYFNIASEEYLLKQTRDYYIYLWKNSPAVIIGNNQNTLLEVDVNAANKKGIKVVRRITGGGAVYHDLNNICYTIIAPYSSEENNYIKFTKPVIEYLNLLGVNATFAGRNDILVDGKKISGNAQVIYKDRIMHHGTILFDADLSVLSTILIQNKIKIQSKGIKSNRARVTNIVEHLPNKLTCEEFTNGLIGHLSKGLEVCSFTENDINNIQKLVENKFSRYEWNIGESPKGSNKIDLKFDFGIITITFDLVKGIIENAEIFGDFFANDTLVEIADRLNGKKFIKEDFLQAFSGIENYIKGANANEIIDKIFE